MMITSAGNSRREPQFSVCTCLEQGLCNDVLWEYLYRREGRKQGRKGGKQGGRREGTHCTVTDSQSTGISYRVFDLKEKKKPSSSEPRLGIKFPISSFQVLLKTSPPQHTGSRATQGTVEGTAPSQSVVTRLGLAGKTPQFTHLSRLRYVCLS